MHVGIIDAAYLKSFCVCMCMYECPFEACGIWVPAGLAGGKASEACVLLAGLPQSIAPRIAKELHRQKIEHERMLFCEYF